MTTHSPTIGIIGGGQLARMMIEAATPLDLDIRLLAASPDDGAARIWPRTTIGSPDDPIAVAAFAAACDVITFDHELVPESVLIALEATNVRLAPSAQTLRIAQNKQKQRELFAAFGLPQPRFQLATTMNTVQTAGADIGFPLILKAARGGYDGRGVWAIAGPNDLMEVAQGPLDQGIVVIIEERVAIERELAVMVARDEQGTTTVLPTVETIQIDGICRQITYRADGDHAQATAIAHSVADAVGLTGIMAVELFQTAAGLLINEIATRPHNSGHGTIEALACSQFAQHLRAVAGLPAGSTSALAPGAVTVNILGGSDGSDPRDRLHLVRDGNVHVHLYGKVARAGRKLGHVTLIGDDLADLSERAWHAVELLTNEKRPEMRR